MKLGLYTLHTEIGRGGMGVVYRGHDPSGRDVAIKLLQGSSEATGRYAREARLQAQLGETEGFVPLIDLGSSPQGPYLVMPYLDGGTLRDRLEAEGQLPLDACVALVRRLATSLGRAHALGIVHRDVKPDNVLFSKGRPLIADLGLAKHFRHDVEGASQSFALSRPGQTRGTFGYMAPEQLKDSAASGPPADVYALGAVLYEVVTGQQAFRAATFVELMTKVAAGKVTHPRRLRPDCPRWLSAVIARALAVDPAQRYPDAAALAEALQAPRASGAARTLAVAAPAALLALGLAAWAALGRGAPPAAEAPPALEEPPPPPPPESSLPPELRPLAEVPDGPRLVQVWGHDLDAGPVLDLAADGEGALSLEASALRRWGRGPRGLALARPLGEARFSAAALAPADDRALTVSDALRGFSLADAAPLLDVALETPAAAVALAPGSTRGVLAMGSTVFVFRVGLKVPPQAEALPERHPDAVTAVAASRTLEFLSASPERVYLHAPGGTRELPHATEVVDVDFAEPGARPLTLDRAGTVRRAAPDLLDEVVPSPADPAALGPAVAMALTPDGQRLAIAHLNGARVLRAVAGGTWSPRGRVLLPPGGARLTEVALSPGGERLLLGTSRGAVLAFALDDPIPPVAQARWTPLAQAGATRGRLSDTPEGLVAHGEELLSASADGWVLGWNADGQPTRALRAGAPLHGLVLRGERLVTQGGGRCLRVWDLTQDPPLETARIGLEGYPLHLALDAQGQRGIVGDPLGNLALVDLEAGRVTHRLDPEPSLASLAVLSDGRLAVGSLGQVELWDPQGVDYLGERLVGGGQVTALAPLADGGFLAGTDRGAILRFGAEPAPPAWITMLGGEAVRSLSLDGDGVLVGMRKGKLLRLTLAAGDTVWEAEDLSGPQLLACALPEGRVAVAGTLLALHAVQAADGQPLWPAFPGHLGPADALSFGPQGETLASVGTDGVRGWRLAGGALEPTWRSPMAYGLQASTGGGGVTLSEELLRPIRAREPLEPVLRLHGPPPFEPVTLDLGEDLTEFAVDPQGRRGYAFFRDPPRGMALNLASGGHLERIHDLHGALYAWAFSADGARLALATAEGLTLEDMHEKTRLLRVDEVRADALAFLSGPGGAPWLLCGGLVGDLEVRETVQGELLRRIETRLGIQALCGAGGQRFLTLGGDGRVHAWDLARRDTPLAELDLGDPTDRGTALAAHPASGRVAVSTGKGRVVVYAWQD